MKNNVLDNNSIRYCTGCGGCSSVCPVNAIIIKEDEEGFFKPFINPDLCIQCGLCKKVCYKYDERYTIQESKSYQSFFAINKNEDELNSSSSGGISNELMKTCIEMGYKVVGVTYDIFEKKVKTIITDDTCSLEKFKGSKYAQSYTVPAFKQICKNIKHEKYAVFGTPCQIYFLSKMADILNARENILLIDCFCHGCPSNLLIKKYTNEIADNRNIGELVGVRFRSKIYGWHNYAFEFIGTKSTYITPKISDPFFDLFFGLDILNEACYSCICRSSIEKCDIRIGDFWGKRFADNSKGVSCVVVNSKKGKELFNRIKNNILYGEVEFNELIKAQSYAKNHSYNRDRRIYLLTALKSENLSIRKIHQSYIRMFPFKKRMKRLLKNTIKAAPSIFVSKLRKIFS